MERAIPRLGIFKERTPETTHVRFEVKKLDLVDGIWVATEMHMTTKKGKTTLHKTILMSENVRFGDDQGEDHFTTRQLEKGL